MKNAARSRVPSLVIGHWPLVIKKREAPPSDGASRNTDVPRCGPGPRLHPPALRDAGSARVPIPIAIPHTAEDRVCQDPARAGALGIP